MLLHKSTEATDEVHPDLVCGIIERLGQVQQQRPIPALGDPGDGGHRDAPVHDGDTGLGGHRVGDGDEVSGRRGHSFDDVLRRPAAAQVDAQRYRPDIEVVTADHPHALEDLSMPKGPRAIASFLGC